MSRYEGYTFHATLSLSIMKLVRKTDRIVCIWFFSLIKDRKNLAKQARFKLSNFQNIFVLCVLPMDWYGQRLTLQNGHYKCMFFY